MIKIVKVAAEDDYTLVLHLDNQEKIVFDMKPRLHAVRFCELSDIEKFKAVSIKNGNILTWGRLCQITIDELIPETHRGRTAKNGRHDE